MALKQAPEKDNSPCPALMDAQALHLLGLIVLDHAAYLIAQTQVKEQPRLIPFSDPARADASISLVENWDGQTG